MTCKKNPEPGGFKYRPQYGVIVICESEVHQERVYRKLQKEGLEVRVVCV